MSTHTSQACCETPVAAAFDYSPKGSFQTHADLSCYVTGPTDARKAIFLLYDIFGFQNPTIQGADILASRGYLVVMPDLFNGKAAKREWMDRDTEEKREAFAQFRTTVADSKPYITKIYTLLDLLNQAFPSIGQWGAIGYCWGGKLVAITSGNGTPWTVGVQTSPGRVDPEDAKKVTIPMAMLASKDEPVEAVAGFEEALKVPKHVETFSTQIHGWMSARAELQDPEVRKEYERGYEVALAFFAKHL